MSLPLVAPYLAITLTALFSLSMVHLTLVSLPSLPIFALHPLLQSLALPLALYGVHYARPSSTPRATRISTHSIVLQAASLALLVGGGIVWYLHDQPGSVGHYVSWHGTIGSALLLCVLGQVGAGLLAHSGIVRLPAAAWTAHRLSGTVLSVLLLLTALLGVLETRFGKRTTSPSSAASISLQSLLPPSHARSRPAPGPDALGPHALIALATLPTSAVLLLLRLPALLPRTAAKKK